MTKTQKRIGIFLFLLSLALHVWKINADLPQIFNSDEPHHLNIAARFGTGDLNPHDFKYPTFWPYVISGVFGLLFVVQRLIGAVSSTQQFAIQYVTDPSLFFLSVRILSALLISSCVWLFYYLGHRFYSESTALIAGLLCLFNPALFAYGRDATHYSLMVFCIVVALTFFHFAFFFPEQKKWWALGGLFLGLSCSTHVIAGPLCLLPFTLWFVGPKYESRTKNLAIAAFFICFGFILGSPFIIPEFKNFLANLRGIKDLQNEVYQASLFSWSRTKTVASNVIHFISAKNFGFLLVILGFFVSRKEHRRLFSAFLIPLIITVPILLMSHFGGLGRYALPVSIPLIFIAAQGTDFLWNRAFLRTIWRVVIIFLLILPLAKNAQSLLRTISLPDTRIPAREWVLKNVPFGEKIFSMNPYECPQFLMAKTQIQRLYERTVALHHPRAEYFKLLLAANRPDGYEIFYLQRTIQEVEDIPQRTESSYQAQDAIDMKKEGVDGLIKRGINWVIINPVPLDDPNSPWIEALGVAYDKVASFENTPGKTKGASIEIYRMRPQI